jgi:hypothetical protein
MDRHRITVKADEGQGYLFVGDRKIPITPHQETVVDY